MDGMGDARSGAGHAEKVCGEGKGTVTREERKKEEGTRSGLLVYVQRQEGKGEGEMEGSPGMGKRVEAGTEKEGKTDRPFSKYLNSMVPERGLFEPSRVILGLKGAHC